MTTLDRIQSNLRIARLLGRGLYYLATDLRDESNVTPATLVADTARKAPNRIAVLFEDQRIGYAEFDGLANRIANVFRSRGAVKGDVVALLMDNRPEYLATIIGLNRLGVVTALVNTHVVGAPLVHALAICKPKFVLVGDEHLANLHAIRDELPVSPDAILRYGDGGATKPDDLGVAFDPLVAGASTDAPPPVDVRSKDPMLFMYTSGTTGLPKAALIKNQRYLRAAYSFGRVLAELGPTDVTYVAVPLYHATGTMAAVGSAIATGGTVALRRKFSASQFWDDCARFEVTCFPYIGELCRYLLQSPTHPLERKHKLRVMMGAGLRADVWTPFVTRFGIPKVVEFYAATEGNVAIINLDQKPGMLGRLLPGQAVIAVDPISEELERDASGRMRRCTVGEKGMLVGRIDAVNRFDGYLDAKKTAEKVLVNPLGDGKDYFNTGDLVELHDEGYVSFADRLGDTFRWKGENVSTTEVSMVLNEHPGVIESNVYGVEVNGHDGRAGMVALVVSDGFDVAGFGTHVGGRLPKYARPVFVRLQRELQLTGSFKYVKTDLKKDGFDPSRMDEPLYVLDAAAQRYVALDRAVYETILSGGFKI